jgi:aminopeptidase N
MLLKEPETLAICQAQYDTARNMTDRQAAFIALVHSEFSVERARVLEDFYQTWRHDPLVRDEWFSAQASSPLPGSFDEVRQLLDHADFSLKNPNKVRSLVGVFCNRNLVNFHREDGAGYAFLADKVLELDELNPQIAARQLTPLTRWGRYTEDRANLMNAQLQRIQAKPSLSKDVFEVVTKSLGSTLST